VLAGATGETAQAAAPVLIENPTNHTAFVGEAHTFAATVSGDAPLSYQWYFNDAEIGGATNPTLDVLSIQTSQAGGYHLVVTNLQGAATSTVATLTVRLAEDPRYAAPQGGWTYLLDGGADANSDSAALDGTWDHTNSSDSWGGDGRGSGNGLAGGVSTAGGILTIEDAIVSGSTSFDNRRIYFTRDLSQDGTVTNAATLLDDGVTMSFRARLTPPSPTDPLTELATAPDGYVNVSDGKGMFGLRQSGGGGALISFTLNQAVEDRSTASTWNFGQAGLHMNSLNGNVTGSFVDPGEGGTVNVLPLDPTAFHEFWITIQDNGTDAGTHRVSIFVDGSDTPTVFNVTAGFGNDLPFDDYLALGVGSTFQVGAFDIDYLAYKAGAVMPYAFNIPVAIVTPPATQYAAENGTATFEVAVMGTPPYSFQWYADGSPIADATNATYTTPPVALADDGTAYTVTVANELNILTSAPPALLEVVLPPVITLQPASLTVTNGDPAQLSVAASSETTLAYQWRRNGLDLPGATESVLLLDPVTPGDAGSFDVLVSNAGGTVASDAALLTVRIQDYGDAPDTGYPVLLSGIGARHLVDPALHLGGTVDGELDGQPDANAAGDDASATDDEDGVVFATPLRAGQPATVEVEASAAGQLDAWIDFQRDNDWSDAVDQVLTNMTLAAGLNVLNFNVPNTAVEGATFARFRFSSTGGLAPDGPAADGEVEDHPVTLEAVADLQLAVADMPDPVAVGSNLTWTITVENLGPSPATGVIVTNPIPAMASWVGASATQGSCVENGGLVTCDLGTMTSGQIVEISLVVTPLASGTLNDTAGVAGNELDLSPANNIDTAATQVLDPPVITAAPVSLVRTNGDNASFGVTATGAAPLSYQWRLNNTDLPGETGDTLDLVNVQPSDAGNYTVRVSNSVGAITSAPATLTVLVAPSIDTQPQGGTHLAGSDVTLSVLASGTEPLRYQWYFNSTTPLAGATDASLLLSAVTIGEGGLYQVEVSNDAGSILSANVQVDVVEVDFGDAPDPAYPTLLAQDGARHQIQSGLFLGAGVDYEPDGNPTSGADGDDSDEGDDEDGVVFLETLRLGAPTGIEVTASASGLLDAWIDWNGDGDWSDAGEQVFTDEPLSSGVNALQIQVPETSQSGATMARFRFSTAGSLLPTGEAPDGEVEDYALTVLAAQDLGVSLEAAPSPVTTGTNLVLTLVVTNTGPSDATIVRVTNNVPAGTLFISATPESGSCANGGGSVVCELPVLAAGASQSIEIILQPLSPGPLALEASAFANEADTAPANNADTIEVQVQDYPELLTQPQSLTVTNGGTAQFSVTATGTDLAYQWQRNGGDLPGATQSTLTVSGASPADEGDYTVRVNNGVGSVTSDPAQLTVLVPVDIVAAPEDTTVLEGGTAMFTVTASGTGPIHYQWLFEGTPLSGEIADSLVLPNVQSAQSGSYQVAVSNAVRILTSDAALLTVIMPATITAQPQSRTNRAGTTAEFSVSATGSAPIHYQWRRDGADLPNATNSLLSLPGVQSTDEGTYDVWVHNAGATNLSAAAELVVWEVDFGDAPDPSFPTLMVFNGARHLLVPGMHLGGTVDFEPDGFNSSDATGDDTNQQDDDDGVTFPSPLLVGQEASVRVVASSAGQLDAWMDFNRNGQWVDPGEYFLSDRSLLPGTNSLIFIVPSSATPGVSFARFRFSSQGGLSADGMALDGEVEDYQVQIQAACDLDVTQQFDAGFYEPDDTVTLDVTVRNFGPSTATSVMVTNYLADNLQLLSAIPSQGECSNVGNLITCNLGDLPDSGVATIFLAATAGAPGLATNIVEARSAVTDVFPVDNTSEMEVPVVFPVVSFQDTATIVLPEIGAATPYPSTVFVSGLTSTIYKVAVTLRNVSHTFPDDLQVLLVGPGGQSALVMDDAIGGNQLNNVTFTLEDDAPQVLPDSGQIFSGQHYRPASYGVIADSMPPPAPPPNGAAYGSSLGVFRNTDPNGTWSLYVADDFDSDSGMLAGGWQLHLTTIDPFTDLTMELTSTPDPVGVGSNIVYQVTIGNDGPSVATGLVFTNLLPDEVSFVSASPSQGSCSVNGPVLTCDLGTLAPGGNVSLQIEVTANVPGLVVNAPALTADQVDTDPVNNLPSVTTLVTPVVDLHLAALEFSDPVLLGELMSLSLVVSNGSPNLATGVLFTDVLPFNAPFQSAVASQGSCTNLGGHLLCDLGEVPGGTAVQVDLVFLAAELGAFTNQAQVIAVEVDGDFANNALMETTSVLPSARLALSGNVQPDPVPMNAPATLFLQVTNTGPSDAGTVFLTNQFPASVVINDITPTQGSCTDLGNGRIGCDLGGLASGNLASVSIQFTAIQSGSLSSVADVLSDVGDPETLDNHLETSFTVLPVADLSVTLTDSPDPVRQGEPLAVQLSVVNNGPEAATLIALTHHLPPEVTFVSASPSQGSCTHTNGTIECSLGSLSSGAGLTVLLNLTASEPGVAVHTAFVASAELDPVPDNNTAGEVTYIVMPQGPFTNPSPIAIAESGPAAPYPSTIDISGLTSGIYRVSVILSNLFHTFPEDLDLLLVGPAGQSALLMSDAGGGIAVTNVTLVVEDDAATLLPDETTLLSGTYQPTDHVTLNDALVPPAPAGPHGASLDVFRGADPNGTWSLYTFDNAAPDSGGLLGGWGLIIETLEPLADLHLTDVATPNPVAAGGTYSHVITVSNQGPAVATGVLLTNELPANATLVDVLPTQGTCITSTLLVTCELGTLAPGATAELILQLTALDLDPQPLASGVSSLSLDTNPSDNSSLVVVTVQEPPVILVGPASQTVTNLSDVAFSVSVTGTEPLAYQWRFQDADIPGATNASLLLDAVGAGDAGEYRIRVSNGVATVLSDPALLTVLLPPMITAVPDQQTDEDVASAPIPITVGDAETPASALLVSAEASDPVLVPPSGLQLSGSGSNRFLTLVPALNQNGQATINVTVQDGDGLVAVTSFLLDVAAVNDPPTITDVPNQVTDEDLATAPIALVVDDVETGAASVTLTATSSNPTLVPGGNIAISGTGSSRSVTITPAANLFGTTTITLRAQDPAGSFATDSFILTVNGVNDPPLLDSIPDAELNEDAALQTVNLTGIQAGPANEVQFLSIAATSDNPALIPNPAVFYNSPDSTGSLFYRPNANAHGTAVISVAVSDGAAINPTFTRQFTVTINPINDLPTLVGPADQASDEDVPTPAASLTIGDLETDLADLILTASADDPILVPNGQVQFSGTGSTRTVVVQPAPNLSGSTLVTITLTDLDGGSTNTSFLATFAPVNDPPTVDDVGLVVMEENQVRQVNLTGITSGAPDEVQTIALTASSSDTNILATPQVTYASPDTTGTLVLTPVTNAFGLVTVTLTLDDGGATNNLTVKTFEVSIGAVNSPPQITAIADQNINEDTSTGPLAFMISDDETASDQLLLSAISANPALVPGSLIDLQGTGTNRTISVRADTNLFGSTLIMLVVVDDEGASNATSFTLTVQAVNDPPTLDPPADRVVRDADGEQFVPLTGITSGAFNEADTLALTAVSSHPARIPNPTVEYTSPNGSGTLRFTPVPGQYGSAQISVTVDDGQATNATVVRSFQVTLQPDNFSPIIYPMAPLSLTEDTPSAPIAITVLDPDGDPQDLILTASSSDPTLIPDANLLLGGAGADRTLILTPLPNQFGPLTITLLLTDNAGATGQAVLAVTVLPVNDPPTLDPIEDVTLDEDGTLVVPLTGIGSGALNEADTLSVTAWSDNPDLIPAPLVAYTSPDAGGPLTLQPRPDQHGSATITVLVQDGHPHNAPVTRTFLATIASQNDLPTLSSLPDLVTDEDTAVGPVALLVNDVETAAGNLLLLARSDNQAVLPDSGLVLGGTGSARTLAMQPAPNASGTATVTVEAIDEDNGTNTASFAFNVNAVNDPPTLILPSDQLIDEDGATAALFIHVEDVDSDPALVVLSATSSQPQLVPSANLLLGGTGTNRTLQLTPAPDAFGNALITVEAHDDAGASAVGTFNLTVNGVDDPPVLEPIPDQSVEAGQTLALALAVHDPDTLSDALILSASADNTTLVPPAAISINGLDGVRTLQITPPADQTGSTLVTVTLDDGVSTPVQQSFTLTVTPGAVAAPRILTGPLSQTVLPGANLLLSVSVAGTAPLTYQWERDGAPLPGANAATLNLVSLQPSDSGAYRVVVGNAAGTATSGAANIAVQTLAFAPVANQVTAEDTALIAPFTVGSRDLDVLGAVLRGSSSNPSLLPDSGISISGFGTSQTVTLTPAPDQFGTVTITLQASNALEVTSTSFDLTVTSVNDPPTINQVADQARLEAPQSFSLPLSGISSGAANETQTLSVSATSDTPAIVSVTSVFYSSPGTTATLDLRPSNNQVGITTITVTVQDSGTGSNVATMAFRIHSRFSSNNNPTLSAIATQNLTEDGTSGPIAFTIGDDATAPGSLVVTATSSNPTLLSAGSLVLGGSGANRTLTINPLPDRSGSATVTVGVSDADFGFAGTQFQVNVAPDNDPPTLTVPGDQTLEEDDVSALLSLALGDVETDPAALLLSAESSDPTLLPASGLLLTGGGINRALQLRPAADESGSATVTLRVEDGAGSITSQSFLVTVNPVNDPPSLSQIADQSVDAGGALGPLAFTVGDAETATGSLLVSAASSNPQVVPQANLALGGADANRSLTLNAAAGESGSSVISLTVEDAAGGVATGSFVVTVNAANQAPTLDPIDDLSLPEDAGPQTLVLTGISAGGTETQMIAIATFTGDTNLLPAPLVLYTNPLDTAVLVLESLPDAHGSALITVSVEDGQPANGSTSRSFTVTILPENDAPVISALPDLVLPEDTSAGPMAFRVADAETDPDLLLLTASSSNTNLFPEGSLLLGGSGTNRTLLAVPALDQSGAALITLSADDGAVTTDSSFTLTILPVNDLPTLTVPADPLIDEDASTGPLSLTVGDVETAAASLLVQVTSSNPLLLPVGGITLGGSDADRTLTLTPAPDQSGLATLFLVVTDSEGGTRSASFSLEVIAQNDPPSLADIADLTMERDTVTGQIPVVISDVETPSADLVLAVASSNPVLLPESGILLAGTGSGRTMQLQLAAGQSGTATLTVTVTDGDGLDAVGTLLVTVTPGNTPPTLSVVPAQVLLAGETSGPLGVTVGDAESPANLLVLSAASSDATLVPPSGLVLGGTGTDRTITVTPSAGQVGVALITLTVLDPEGASAVSSFVVTVQESQGEGPPVITLQPQGVTNWVGQTATFAVAATGQAPLSVQWFYKNQPLPAATSFTLVVPNVDFESRGEYRAVVSNALGSVSSDEVILDVLGVDFGDAPDPSYPTLLSNNGARHFWRDNVFLGSGVDFEADGQPNEDATGDNVLDGSVDEDGVAFLTPLLLGQDASVEVAASRSGFLNAWLDFGRDGSWAEAGDQVFTNAPVFGGANLLAFSIPLGASPGPSYIRFRFNTASGLSYDGVATDGEVEDYAVTLASPVDLGLVTLTTLDTVPVGSNLTYQIMVTNRGPFQATGVTLTNLIPTASSFIEVLASQGSCLEAGGLVECTLGTLAPQTAALIEITVQALALGTLTNEAEVVSVETDLNAADNLSTHVNEVTDRPIIVSQPASQTVTNGATGTFQVQAIGLPVLTYQWFLDDTPLDGATGDTLVITGAQSSDLGAYRVEVTNPNGTVSSLPALLQPALPPVVQTRAATAIHSAGATLQATVHPMGLPTTARFEWGTTIAYGNLGAVTLIPAQSIHEPVALPITGLTPGLAYHFRITATNDLGSAVGEDRTLQWDNTPPVITAITRLPSGAVRLDISGASNQVCEVEAGMTATNYSTLGNAGESAPAEFEFLDVEAPAHPMRFYRVLSP